MAQMQGGGKAGWDAGAWFGSQLGGTLWMAIAAPVLAPGSPGAAAVVGAAFLAVNGFGLLLWSRRARLQPLRSMRALVLAIGAGGLAALGAAHASGQWSRLEVGGRVPPGAAYGLVVGVCAVMWLVLHRRERAGG